jgi:subtilisin family serine protease
MYRHLVALALALLVVPAVSAEILSSDFAAKLAADPKANHTAIVRLSGPDVPVGEGEGKKSGRLRLNRLLRERFQRSSAAALAQIGEWRALAKTAKAEGRAAVRDVNEVSELWLSNALIVKGTGQAISDLASIANVAAILPDKPRRLLPVYPGRAEREGEYTYGLKKIGADRVQTELGASGEGVLVGVLDTGIDPNHPDIAGKVTGFRSFVNQSDPNTPNDGHGHGTHCAGTIAGGKAGGTQIGVAPKAKLLIGQIFTASGSTTDAAILGAMSWIADPDNNPDTDDAPALVSNSWGGSPGSMESEKPYWDSVANWVRLGIFPSFAAGNEGPGVSTMGTPGGYPHSFAAGATDSNDKIAYFSSRGPITWADVTYTKPDVSAPGVNVISAKPGGGYQSMSGTSMACPHVSGVAALLYAANPDYSIEQVSGLLKETSSDLGDAGHDNVFGMGRINAHAALSVALNGGKVSIKLTNESGAAIPGRVRITGGASTTIADSGATTLVLVAGSYTLVASSFGYLESAEQTVAVAAGQTTEVTFVLKAAPKAKVTVTIKDNSTQAALPGKVSVVDAPITESVADPSTGIATIEVPYGTYTFKVRAFAYETATLKDVKVDQPEMALEATLAHLPDILLYDDDAGKTYETFYQASLTALNKPFSYLASAKDDDTILAYPVIVYFTGDDYNGTVDDATQETLKKYLASGGRLLITGQDIGYDLKTSAFLADVMHAKFVKDTAGSREVSGSGFSFNIQGGDGANNQKYPDVIEALEGASALFNYGGSDGPAGLVSSVGSGKVVYLPFGFEGIDTADNRQKVLDHLLRTLAPSFREKAERLGAIRTVAGEQAATAYRAYLIDSYEKMSAADQAANAQVLRGLTPR